MLEKIKTEFEQSKTLLLFGLLRLIAEIAPLVVAKFFSPALFASYSLAKMIVFFFTSLLITSAQVPFIVFANQEKAKTGKINKSFSVQCMFLLSSGVIFLSVNILFSQTIMQFAALPPAGLIFMILAFIGIATNSFLENLFMALGQRVKSSLVSLLFGGSILVLVFILHFTGNLNLNTVLLVYLVSGFIITAVFIKTIPLNLLFPFDFNWAHFKEMFNFTKWVMLGATAVYLINWADNIILKIFNVSMADIGDYNLAHQIFKGTLMLIYVINAYFLPFVSEHIEDGIRMKNYLYNKRPKIFFTGTAAIVLLFMATPHILGFIYGSDYPKATVVLRILLVASELMLYNAFYLPIINALKAYKFSQTINVVQIFVSIILNVILIPRFGLIGAAVATVIAYLGTTVVYETYFRIIIKKMLLNNLPHEESILQQILHGKEVDDG